MIQETKRIQHESSRAALATQAQAARAIGHRGKIAWTLGNLLMIVGCYLLIYICGIYANAEFNRLAARGDNDLAPPPAARVPLPPSDLPAAFHVPVLTSIGASEGTIRSAVPPPAADAAYPPQVSRVVIPSIDVDSKVVGVGWEIVEQNGQQTAIWQVAEYAVGQHQGSHNPGDGGNIVLAGHVGGYGKVFKDLFYVNPGDPITLFSNGGQYRYTVSEKLVVDEEGVPDEQRAANARYIEPTDHEVVTMLTCWPPTGPQRFTQRVIVRAVPFGADKAIIAAPAVSNWTIR